MNRGELDEAERDSLEALRLIRDDDSRMGTILPLVMLARVALARGDYRRAGLLWGVVDAEMSRSPHGTWERVRSDRAGPLLERTDPAFLSALDEGRAAELWGAVEIALGEIDPPSISSS